MRRHTTRAISSSLESFLAGRACIDYRTQTSQVSELSFSVLSEHAAAHPLADSRASSRAPSRAPTRVSSRAPLSTPAQGLSRTVPAGRSPSRSRGKSQGAIPFPVVDRTESSSRAEEPRQDDDQLLTYLNDRESPHLLTRDTLKEFFSPDRGHFVWVYAIFRKHVHDMPFTPAMATRAAQYLNLKTSINIGYEKPDPDLELPHTLRVRILESESNFIILCLLTTDCQPCLSGEAISFRVLSHDRYIYTWKLIHNDLERDLTWEITSRLPPGQSRKGGKAHPIVLTISPPEKGKAAVRGDKYLFEEASLPEVDDGLREREESMGKATLDQHDYKAKTHNYKSGRAAAHAAHAAMLARISFD